MTFDPTDVLIAKYILGTVFVTLLLAWAWHMRASQGSVQLAKYRAELELGHKDQSAWREALNSLRGDFNGRISAIEEKVRHMPSSKDFAELEGEVRAVIARQEAFDDGQKAIRQSLHRIEDYLLRGKRP